MVGLRIRSFFMLSLLTLLWNTAASAQRQPDPAKRGLVREVLDLTQVADQSLAVMEQAAGAQRQANPNIPGVFWDRFIVRARERRQQLVDLLVPIYEKAFTTDDLRAMLAFYRTPAGRRLLEAQPRIIQQSMEAGQQWGAMLGQEVAKELAAEGVRID